MDILKCWMGNEFLSVKLQRRATWNQWTLLAICYTFNLIPCFQDSTSEFFETNANNLLLMYIIVSSRSAKTILFRSKVSAVLIGPTLNINSTAIWSYNITNLLTLNIPDWVLNGGQHFFSLVNDSARSLLKGSTGIPKFVLPNRKLVIRGHPLELVVLTGPGEFRKLVTIVVCRFQYLGSLISRTFCKIAKQPIPTFLSVQILHKYVTLCRLTPPRSLVIILVIFCPFAFGELDVPVLAVGEGYE